jgi:hypothetical protein
MVVMTEDYMSPAAAAKVLDLTPERVRQFMRAGSLEFTLTPIGRIIPTRAVMDLAEKRARKLEKAAGA